MNNTKTVKFKIKIISYILMSSLIIGIVFVIPSKANDIINVSFTSPYSGNYLVATNTSTNVSNSQDTGFISSSLSVSTSLTNIQSSDISEENIIVAVEEIDGQTMYRYEPAFIRNFDVDKENLESSTSRLYNLIYAAYTLNQTKVFSVYDFNKGLDYNMTAKLLYSGAHCTVWVDVENSALTAAKAKQLGEEFDNNIYGKMNSNFGIVKDADFDGKLAIVCYDIRDNYYYGQGNSYIAGYFYGGDILKVNQGGNGNVMDMINIDTYPLMSNELNPDVTKSFSTIAHEMQHAIAFTDYLNTGLQTQQLELWLNEAFSMAAEHMIYGTLNDRIQYYNNSQSIKNGSPVIYKDYASGDDAMLAGYSQSYLFAQYLRTQTQGMTGGGDQIFKTILNNSKYDYTAVESALVSTGYGGNFSTFLRNYKIALLTKESTGPYGLKGDASFDTIQTQFYTGSSTILSGGGASIVKEIDSPVNKPSNAGADIQFAGVYIGPEEQTPTVTATVEPTPTPSTTAEPTPTATPEPTPTATATVAPTPTATVAPTPTATVAPTPTITVTPSTTPTATTTPTVTETPNPTQTPTATPTSTTTPTATPTPTPEIPFSDLDNVVWAQEAIIYLVGEEIINGYDDGTFKPSNNITRAEFTKLLVLAFDVYDPEALSTFTDLLEGKWYNSYVASAEEEGLTEGNGQGMFLPESTITREEMFIFSARVIAKYKGYELLAKASEEIDAQLNEFIDGNTVSDWAKEYVASVIKHGLVTGSTVEDGRVINPKNAITRAESAVVLYRAMILE